MSHATPSTYATIASGVLCLLSIAVAAPMSVSMTLAWMTFVFSMAAVFLEL